MFLAKIYGFLGRKEYAIRPATRLTTKLRQFPCLGCSIFSNPNALKNFILLYPVTVAYVQRCRGNETYPRAGGFETDTLYDRDSGKTVV